MPKANACWDHLGRKYKSHAEMCKSWGVGKRTFLQPDSMRLVN